MMPTVSITPPITISIVVVMKPSLPAGPMGMLMEMPLMMIRMQAMMAEKMAITRVATTRHLLPLCAPPMASPPVVMKNTAASMPEVMSQVIKRGKMSLKCIGNF